MNEKTTILIFDDSPTYLAVSEQYLTGRGYNVLTASVQAEAYEALDNDDVDLLCIDWEMPESSGLEFVRGLRSGWKFFDLPVMLISGKHDPLSIIDALNAGCDDFVSKEEGLEILGIRIERMLRAFYRLNIGRTFRKERQILLVDDSPTFLISTQQFLEKMGLNVITASSGREALGSLDKENADLIAVDWMMPEMDGLELIQTIRSKNRYKDIPVIMLTGEEGHRENILLALDAGADDFINKEYDLCLLEKKIGILLRIQEQYRRYTRQIALDKEEVEKLVQKRTAELEKTNAQLRQEIEDRREAEAQLSEAFKEKEVLLREIHHRVKNNMQVIISLLRLQARKIKDADTKAALQDSQNRVSTISLIHETLYWQDSFAAINMKKYLTRLSDSLHVIYKQLTSGVKIAIYAEDLELDIDHAIPCGLIVNELISNCFKYAFPGGHGKIEITAESDSDDSVKLVISDDGIGLPDNIDFQNAETMGLSVVASLVQRQLNGTVDIIRDKGTQFFINFRRKTRSQAHD
ncbi:MAG: response regulator [Desulfobacteraceae bacterium]|nr:response regulator [Desulfobacteraceae bacterium]